VPPGAYHVFRNLGPAAFIGIALYPLKGDKFIRETLNRAIFGQAEVDGELISLKQTFENALRRFDTTAEISRASHAELDRSLAMRKTTGYQDKPNRAAITRRTLDNSCRLRWEFEGVVATSTITDATELIVRGQSIKFTRPLDFDAMCHMSAIQDDFGLVDLIEIMPDELPRQDRNTVAQRLYDYGAISTT
jgi:hypothetical protein